MQLSIDIELTNRCNAKCHFCPRDRTPHQGLMSPETFSQALRRAAEYRDLCLDRLDAGSAISLCGLGEPLLNKHAPEFVRQVRAAGFDVTMSSNGSVLNERRSAELLEAGLQNICINVGEVDDDYEEVYGLPFERTLENVLRFHEMAEQAGTCEVTMVLVNHRVDPEHIAKMRAFWEGHGIESIFSYEVMNRGGSLFVDHMQYESYGEVARARSLLEGRVGTPMCRAPLYFLFVGYDGQYYLCCSDWEKQTPMGSVFDASFLDVTQAKLQYVASRDPVCKTCNLDPANKLAEDLRAEALGQIPEGTAAAQLEALVDGNHEMEWMVDRLGFDVPPPPPNRGARRLIPVQAS